MRQKQQELDSGNRDFHHQRGVEGADLTADHALEGCG